MKKLLLPLVAIALLVACKKDKTTPAPTPTPAAKDGFVWKEDGGAEITADSAFWTSWSSGTGVRAYKGGMSNFFEINWDVANNTSVGTKALDAGKGVTFLKGSATYTNAGSESMNITAFGSDKLSGNFTVTMTGGTIKEVTGTFTNIPKR
ncbi:MAG: hypothetical protein WC716_05700 [Chitinophagaceae bacterium]|jgi:hypothetical protein